MAKKFINLPENVVSEMFEGMIWASGGQISQFGVHDILMLSNVEEVKAQQVEMADWEGVRLESAFREVRGLREGGWTDLHFFSRLGWFSSAKASVRSDPHACTLRSHEGELPLHSLCRSLHEDDEVEDASHPLGEPLSGFQGERDEIASLLICQYPQSLVTKVRKINISSPHLSHFIIPSPPTIV